MKRLFLVVLLAAPSLRAATFLVPDDKTLVRASRAVVVATAGESHSRWSDGGWIETVTAMHVDEAIRGPLRDGQTFEVTELGGKVGEMIYVVAGSPRYARGERVLLFLETTDRGAWCAKNMVVGKFDFARDTRSRQLLVREANEIAGWDVDGTPHREPMRLANEFLRYVRGVARGEEPAADYVVAERDRSPVVQSATPQATLINTYLLGYPPTGVRWNTFPAAVQFLSHGTQPGAVNGGVTAVQRGVAAWTNDGGSNVVMTYAGTTTTSNGLSNSDGVNSVQFNDPLNEIPGAFSPTSGATLAIGGAFATGSHTFNGESFATIVEADLVVQNGITGSGLTGNGFDHVITHELGHCIGLRHSDQPPAGGTQSSDAVMFSSVNFNADTVGANLLSWDREALAAVYPSGSTPTPPTPPTPPPPPPPPACTPPSILSQPHSASTINTAVTLTVIAAPLPLSYQWYIGAKGDTSSPINGAFGTELMVLPSVTTSYWVRVSNNCNPPADSDAAVVTVNGCPIVTIDSQSPSTSIVQNKSATLSVSASGGTGITYQWYVGTAGSKVAPIAGATSTSLTVTPAGTTSYWLEATNSCGASARTDTIVVTVTPCSAPKVVVQPAGGQVVSGESITLAAAISASQPLALQWFEGARLDTSHPVIGATGPSLTTPPVIAPTTFWLRATNDCGEADSVSAPVTIAASCIAPSITTQPASVTIAPNSSATLSVVATGTSLTYVWYQGQVFDFTHPVGVSSPVLVTSPLASTTQFWVRVTNNCGAANSTAATVVAAVGKRRGVAH